MNVFCMAGTIEELPVLKETPNGIKTCTVLLRCERPFANSEGIYESDLIQIEVWRGLAQTICSVSKVGNWIVVKGRISSRMLERDERTFYNYTFVAEHIEFIKKTPINGVFLWINGYRTQLLTAR